MLHRSIVSVAALLCWFAGGCALVPDARHRERFHNPLPQLHTVAVLPFFNQSSEPTLDQIAVAEAYYAQLQAIPGFEVVPVGVTISKVESYVGSLASVGKYPAKQLFLADGMPVVPFQQIDFSRINFQDLAAGIGVDAVVVGSVTDYTPYYPPRMAMTTRWYAANPAFHPVPAGYGLPWGTKAEKKIPRRVKLETELELARAQLATQTPLPTSEALQATPQTPSVESQPPMVISEADLAQYEAEMQPAAPIPTEGFQAEVVQEGWANCDPVTGAPIAPLPMNWPDPTRLIPDGPSPSGPPVAVPQASPVLSHTRIYRGDDMDFTERLAQYVYANDDGRIGGWEGYLTRSDDFIRFCCYLHITEMLEMRGGRDESDLILRWPISRYSR